MNWRAVWEVWRVILYAFLGVFALMAVDLWVSQTLAIGIVVAFAVLFLVAITLFVGMEEDR